MDKFYKYRLLLICILCKGYICYSCPSTCITCESESYCRECKPGFYGDVCSDICKSYCRNNRCSKFMGLCDSCEEGYFLNKDRLCIECPINCLKCITTEFCSECVTGFRGDICHEQCVNCKIGTHCEKISGHCNTCNDGFSGLLCDTKCNPKCKSCKRIEKDECISCSHNTYGENCNYSCSSNCLEAACNKTDGSCTLGCSNGHWGSRCNNTCDVLCQDSRCIKVDGNCTRIGKNSSVTFLALPVAFVLLAATFCVCMKKRKRLSKVFRLCCNEMEHQIPTCDETEHPISTTGNVQAFMGICKGLFPYYIYDTDGRRAYIGCRDPISKAQISEFWEVIWNESCDIIVMLLEKEKKLPSCIYWPELNVKVKFGSIRVKTCAVNDEDDCAERIIKIKKNKEKIRTIFQSQGRFTRPLSVTKVLQFLERVKIHTERKLFGPVLVHSSDGVRMCGMYMALDMYHKNLEQRQNTKTSEISDRLREQNKLLLGDMSEIQVLEDQQLNCQETENDEKVYLLP